MYGFNVKEVADKQQDLGFKRKHTSNIQRRQMPSGSFLRAGQPDVFKMVQCKSEQEKPDLINDTPALECEADIMGKKAVQGKFRNAPVWGKNVACSCIQRRIPEAGELGNYEEGGEGTKIIQTPLEAKDKVEALQKISEEAAGIGKKADQELQAREWFNVVIMANYKRRSYGPLKKRYDVLQSQIAELDHNYDAESYEKKAHRKAWEEEGEQIKMQLNPVTLSLKYQFRKQGVDPRTGKVGGPGYIISVNKTSQKNTRVNYQGTMVNSRGSVDKTNTYSNQHDSTVDKTILEQTYKKNNETDKKNLRSKNFDAYTKLAGEGARFQCVRRNIAKIKDDTVIHAKGEDKGVKFCELWLTWSATFQKKYDIGDTEIAQKLGGTDKYIPKNTLWINKPHTTNAVPVDNSNHIELEN